jgi:hypothetical protein
MNPEPHPTSTSPPEPPAPAPPASPEDPRSKFVFCFVHIPKAAGTTLQDIVVRQFRGGKAFRFIGTPAQAAEFQNLPQQERDRYDLLTGHVHFGIHEWSGRPPLYLTMLRDPVDRVISHYYFALSQPTHYMYRIIRERNLTLKDYAATRATVELDNDQVRWLTTTPHRDIPTGKVPRRLLDEAKWNLENAFSCIGLTERFDESLACMQAAFGWKDVSYERRNVTRERPPLAEISQDTLDAIREVNALDAELYEFAKVLFEEQLGRYRLLSRAADDAAAGTLQLAK